VIRIFVAVLLACASAAPACAQARFPGEAWTVVSHPTARGWDTAQLARARRFADSIGSSAVMVVHDGEVLAQWGDVAARTDVYSVRKSLLSALIGIAVHRKQLDTAATLAQLGIDDVEGLTDGERSARVVDLLTARSGVYHPAAYETAGMRNQRPARGSHAPGTFFFYNNWDFNALGSIYEGATGQTIFGAFLEQIAKPIGMEDLRLEDMRYFREPVSHHPAYLFRMSARDLARFGVLFLNEGEWRGRTVVPREWVRWSTSPLADQGVRGGYGAMWWVATDPTDPVITVPVGTFSARGNYEQNVFVFPASRLVIVHRGDPDRPIRVQSFGKLLRLILAARLQ
jgi:CubicO group peptidase (beta-lactamase class C family)